MVSPCRVSGRWLARFVPGMEDSYLKDETAKTSAISQCRWDAAKEVRCSVAPEVLSKVCLQPIGAVAGYTVWLVDGPAVRDLIDIDYTQGGNPLVYGYVPLKEIWLEDKGSAMDLASTLLHELVESHLMTPDLGGLDYNTAHDLASGVENPTRGPGRPQTKAEIFPWVKAQYDFWIQGQSKVADVVKDRTMFASLMKNPIRGRTKYRVILDEAGFDGKPPVSPSYSVVRVSSTLLATKSPAEKEDEAIEDLIRPAPTKKPPRYDLRNERVEIDKEKDEFGAEGDKDLSLNYKKVATRWMMRIALVGKTPPKNTPKSQNRQNKKHKFPKPPAPYKPQKPARGEKGKEEGHKPGDVWQTDNGYAAKNPKGVGHGFPGGNGKEQAEAYAKGKKYAPEKDKGGTSELERPDTLGEGTWKKISPILKKETITEADFQKALGTDNIWGTVNQLDDFISEDADGNWHPKKPKEEPERPHDTPESEGEKKPPDERKDPAQEPSFVGGGSKQWTDEHRAKTPGGSSVLGTPHLGEDDSQDAYIEKEVIPAAISAAEEAIKAGKKVVYLAEGKPGGTPDTEQEQIANALQDKFGDKVEQGTFDDEGLTYNPEYDDVTGEEFVNPEAPVVRTLAKHFGGDKEAVVAALYAFDAGQDTELRLTPEIEKVLKSWGIDPKKPREMYLAAFPHDAETDADNWFVLKKMKKNPVAAVQAALNHLRQDNMHKKIKEIEAAGGVAIVTPGASHAYEMKPLLESGGGANVPGTTEEPPPDAAPPEEGEQPPKGEKKKVPKEKKEKEVTLLAPQVEDWLRKSTDKKKYRTAIAELKFAFNSGSLVKVKDDAPATTPEVAQVLKSLGVPDGTFKTTGDVRAFLKNAAKYAGIVGVPKPSSEEGQAQQSKSRERFNAVSQGIGGKTFQIIVSKIHTGADEDRMLKAYAAAKQEIEQGLRSFSGEYDEDLLKEAGKAFEQVRGKKAKTKKKKKNDDDDDYGYDTLRLSSTPEEIGRKLALAEIAQKELTNPLEVFHAADYAAAQAELDREIPEEERKAKLLERALQTADHFKKLTPQLRAEAAVRIQELMKGITDDTDTPRALVLNSILDGMALAAAAKGESVEANGVFLRPELSPSLQVLVRMLAKRGDDKILLGSMKDFDNPENRKKLHGLLSKMSGRDISDILGGETGPYGELLQSANWERDGSAGEEEAKKMLMRMAVNEMTNFQAVLFAVASNPYYVNMSDIYDENIKPPPSGVISETITRIRSKIKLHKTKKALTRYTKCMEEKRKAGIPTDLMEQQCAHLKDDVEKAHSRAAVDAIEEETGKRLDPGNPLERQMLDDTQTGKAKNTPYVPAGTTDVHTGKGG